MIRPGTVVTVEFPGALGVKRRPAIVVSSATYHTTRPDVVLGLLTSQIASATGPTDYTLHDWSAAGLHSASAFRVIEDLPGQGIHLEPTRLQCRQPAQVPFEDRYFTEASGGDHPGRAGPHPVIRLKWY
jgi:hypothetical protein